MFAATAADFTGDGTANILVNRVYSPLGIPAHHTLEQRPPVLLKAVHAVYMLFGVRKIATSSYHLNDNDGAERVNHTMAQILAMEVNEFEPN